MADKKLSDNATKAFQEDPKFAQAYEDAPKIVSAPPKEEKARLYGLFKVGCNEDFKEAYPTMPGVFNFYRRAMAESWKKVLDDGITPEQAREQYVALIEEWKQKYGFDPNKVAE
ncbi:hypothetical protein GGS20DRAFT_584425 [Poronia punctata]|nr:hypothetical protein GGS20DRAFT_584425 [Poronia punctata]